MKKIFFIVIFCAIGANVFSQGKTTIHKPTRLEGIIQKADLFNSPYANWYSKYHKNYTPDAAVVEQLKKRLKNITIKAYMGTWCQDSKLEVPRFYKLLEAADFDEDNLEMIAVNRVKKTRDNLQEGYHIIRVPTFIFYKNGEELGRFVEYPIATLEKDILKILSQKPYKHAYWGQ